MEFLLLNLLEKCNDESREIPIADELDLWAHILIIVTAEFSFRLIYLVLIGGGVNTLLFISFSLFVIVQFAIGKNKLKTLLKVASHLKKCIKVSYRLIKQK